MADDLSSNNEFRRLMDRVRRLENTTMLQNAAISEGGLTVYSDDPGLRVEGLLTVTGTEVVDGTLRITGTFLLEGGMTVSGSLDVTGPWEISGDGDITGDVDLTGALSVLGGGRVKVGTALELTPAVDGGAIIFQSDSTQKVYGNGSAVGLRFGSNGINVGATLAGLLVGSRAFNVTDAGFAMTNLPTITSAASGGLPVGAMHVSTSGVLSRVVA